MKKFIRHFLISLSLAKMTIAEEVAFAFGIKLNNDPDATSPPYTQAQLQALATTVQTDVGARLTDPHPDLTAQEQLDVDDLSSAIYDVKNYVESVANKKAKGDKAIFDLIVKRIGFTPKKTGQGHPRGFEALPAEKGSFHVRVKAAKGRVTYVFEYGITTAEDVLPPAWEKPIALPVTELIVNGIPSGSIIAVRYTAILPPSHTKKTNAKSSKTVMLNATILVTNKSKKVTVTHSVAMYNFSDILYIRVS